MPDYPESNFNYFLFLNQRYYSQFFVCLFLSQIYSRLKVSLRGAGRQIETHKI
jgi:hypothetical protein